MISRSASLASNARRNSSQDRSGSRSRSPLRPASLRMMSRAVLTIAPSRALFIVPLVAVVVAVTWLLQLRWFAPRRREGCRGQREDLVRRAPPRRLARDTRFATLVADRGDRKSTRLNSSHLGISY